MSALHCCSTTTVLLVLCSQHGLAWPSEEDWPALAAIAGAASSPLVRVRVSVRVRVRVRIRVRVQGKGWVTAFTSSRSLSRP